MNASTTPSTLCWHCNSPIPENQFYRQDSCPKCSRDTHVCKNCFHHDQTFNNQCKESQADRVVDKEKSNFCDYFKPSGRSSQKSNSQDQIRAAAEALFKKKS